MSKRVCEMVPAETTYRAWSDLDHNVVGTTWHSVYWPPREDQDDFVAYDYCDTNFRHAWTVHVHYAWFADADEATQFALLFGG